MTLTKCLHPVKILNLKKEIQYVPCGKCEACRSLKSYQWKKRLDSEMSSNRFALAITLTYDDAHLPTIIVNSDKTVTYNFYEDKREFYVSDEVYNELPFYYRKRRDGSFLIPVVSHSDLQIFIKRLKSYAPAIRWFIQSEIGPSTLRSHYHGILFFSEYEPQYIIEAIPKAWDKCDWSIPEHRESLHIATSASYCTQYVASVLDLPKIHNFGRFAMFHYCSNRPPIGSLSYSSDDIKKYEKGEAIDVVRYDIKSNAFVSVPYLRSLQDKCFGKIPNYSLLSDATRKFCLNSYRYFSLPERKTDDRPIKYDVRFEDYARRFTAFLESDECQFDFFKDVFTSNSSMYRVYRCSKSYYQLCEKYSPLLVDYAFDEHYYKLEMSKLRQQYLYEEDFCNNRHMSCRWLIFKDLSFVAKYQDAFGYVPSWVESTLLGYDFQDLEDFTSNVYNYELRRNVDAKAYFSRIHKIIHESHKTRVNRSYERAKYVSYLSDSFLKQFDVDTQLFGDNKQNQFCPF